MTPARVATVAQYMTPNPETIAPDALASEARRMMRALSVRHLPVRRLGEIIGIVSERDLDALDARLDEADRARALVDDAMTPFPYEVSPETPLEHAAAMMQKGKYGAALVMQHGRLVGLF